MVIELLFEEEWQQMLLLFVILMGFFKYDEGGYCDIFGKRFMFDQVVVMIKNEVFEGFFIRKIMDDNFDVDVIVSYVKLNMVLDENGFSFNIFFR